MGVSKQVANLREVEIMSANLLGNKKNKKCFIKEINQADYIRFS